MATALKREKISENDLVKVTEIMCRLNRVGEKLAALAGVHAMTDVTGFGLLGHLIELCEGSDLSAVINYKNVPLIEGIEKYTDQFIFPDNTYRNWNISYSHIIENTRKTHRSSSNHQFKDVNPRS